MVAADHSFLDPEYDEYAASTSRSIVCCRTLALIVSPPLSLFRRKSWEIVNKSTILMLYWFMITMLLNNILWSWFILFVLNLMQFMVLLIMRHTLPVVVSRAGNYSLPLIMVSSTNIYENQKLESSIQHFLNSLSTYETAFVATSRWDHYTDLHYTQSSHLHHTPPTATGNACTWWRIEPVTSESVKFECSQLEINKKFGKEEQPVSPLLRWNLPSVTFQLL